MPQFDDKLLRTLTPLAPETVAAVREAGRTPATEQALERAVQYALQCGGTPPRRVQPREGETCTPEVVLYDAPCTEQLALCHLFRADAFVTAQKKLAILMSRRPASPEMHMERAEWCYEVLSTVADALDATNVRPEFFNTWGLDEQYTSAPPSEAGPALFRNVAAFIEGTVSAVGARTGDDPVFVPIAPSMGGNTTSDPDSKRPIETAPSFGTWYTHLSGALANAGTFCQGPVVTDRIHDTYRDDSTPRDSQYFKGRSREYLRYLFLHHPESGLAPGQYCYKTNVQDRSRKWAKAWVLTGDMLMNYCAAWAQDIMTTGMDRFVAVGLVEWLRQLVPFYANGQLDPNFPMEDIKSIVTQNARDTAIGTTQTAFGLVGTVVAMVPVIGWLLALIVFIVQVIVSIILFFADMAAGWSCPLLPFKRSAVSGDCAITEVGSSTDVERIRADILPALAEYTGMESFRRFVPAGPPQGPPPIPPAPPSAMVNESSKPLPLKTVGWVMGGVIGGALLLRLLRNR